MILTVTGTPGTGKTSVSERLEFPVIDLTEFVRQREAGEQEEEFEVDIDQMVKFLDEEIKDREGDVLIEGHLSHHFQSDYCIVLRCRPDKLRKRLEEREYPEEKIEENIESEKIDLILYEAVEKQENIIEIDTTGKEPKQVAEEIEERIEKDETGYGDIDWTEFI